MRAWRALFGRRTPDARVAPGFVDLHCHLLPGVDDGAADIVETLAMLALAYEGGTRRIVATPHLFHPAFPPRTAAEIRERFARLIEELQGYADEPRYRFLPEIEICLGAEHHVSGEFLDALERGGVLPLNGGRHLLVELPELLPWPAVSAALLQVREAGFVPVLAHVERVPSFQKTLERLASVRDMGCVAQVNADSFLGRAGRRPHRASRAFLKRGLVDVIASDGHRPVHRSPNLRPAFEWLSGKYLSEEVSVWMVEAPAGVIRPAG